MKCLWGFCLLFSHKKLFVLDKSHVKTYANQWIQTWKDHPDPLSDLRINEAWKSIIWCTENKHKDYSHCLVYKHTNYFIIYYCSHIYEFVKQIKNKPTNIHFYFNFIKKYLNYNKIIIFYCTCFYKN